VRGDPRTGEEDWQRQMLAAGFQREFGGVVGEHVDPALVQANLMERFGVPSQPAETSAFLFGTRYYLSEVLCDGETLATVKATFSNTSY